MNSISSTQKFTTSAWVQAMVWLIVALIVGVVTFMLWMASAAPTMKPDVVPQDEKRKAQMSLDFNKITHVENLNELRKEVKPISFDALVRDLRQYPKEFKDKSYFKQHEKDWTVQVMDVAEHKVITDYLNGREDRNKFAYFRYRDENDQPRYILTYDALPTPQLAMGTAKIVDFDLPENIRVLPEEMSRYLTLIENYELSQPVENVNLNPSRRVKLKPAKQEIPPRPAPVAQDNAQTDTLNEQGVQPSIADSADAEDTLAVNVKREARKSDTDKAQANPLSDAETSAKSSNDGISTPKSASTAGASTNTAISNTSSNTAPSNTAPSSNTPSNTVSSLPTPKPVEATPPSQSNKAPANNTGSASGANTSSTSGAPKPVPTTSKADADALGRLIIEKTE